jgi:NAD-dependent deacetylase
LSHESGFHLDNENAYQIEISKELRTLWRPSTRVCVLTGAGVSQESGVPTFRDKDGLWQKFKPEELANMDAFLANPDLVWDWYQHRRQVVRDVFPNDGHVALAAMESFFNDFTLVTQNVDGLHARAGSNKLLEVHGNILRSFCVKCGEFASQDYLENLAQTGKALCQKCTGLLRPDVVWFGEMLPADIYEQADRAARNCELFLSVGTSGAVFPAAGLPLVARDCGAYVVEINPKPTEISRYMSEVLCGSSAKILKFLGAIHADNRS